LKRRLLWLSWIAWWEGGSNIIHWWCTSHDTTKFQMEWFFSWIIQGTNIVEKQGAMVGPWISFVATLGWIDIGHNNSSSLWFYDQVL
jgi:hypothetical protein